MSNITPSGSGGSTSTVIVSGASNPTITNVALASASTEVAIALPSNCKKFVLKLRETLPIGYLQVSLVENESNVTYVTLPHGSVYSDDNLDATGITLYVQSTVAGQVAELLTWT